MGFVLQIHCNKNLYLRDPEQSVLGKKIVSQAIHMIHELGFENFTFKKLAKEIESTEASVYRYYENKHQLLAYLSSWYWAWLEYMIDYKTNNIADPWERMEIVIQQISQISDEDPTISHIDEQRLHSIVINESSKAYLTKRVDEEEKAGYFTNYFSVCERIASIMREINPDYPYSQTLASNLIETAHEQIFFSQHLPSLTDLRSKGENHQEINNFLMHLVKALLSYESVD